MGGLSVGANRDAGRIAGIGLQSNQPYTRTHMSYCTTQFYLPPDRDDVLDIFCYV